MPASPHIGLPFLEAGQAQKHVTHNEALRILDALVQLSVVTISASPPGAPEEGERHIVAEGAGGAFASHDNKVAVHEDGAWRFLMPRAGWRAWNEAAQTLLLWTGTEWSALETGGGFDPDDVDHLYLNDAAPGDADVKFAMRGEAALLHAIPAAESGSGDVRLQISKEGASDTASVFFSTGFNGRAEFGLVGGDNFKLKVSADGANWIEALDIDKGTGRVRLPAALALADADQVAAKRHIRELLIANRAYYVRADGSDSNDGLEDSSGGAFATIQKAVDAACALDLSIYSVAIYVGPGTYPGGVILKKYVGTGPIHLVGDIATPANVIVSATGTDCFNLAHPVEYNIQGFELRTSASGSAFRVSQGVITHGNNRFGACATDHFTVFQKGTTRVAANYAISGGASRHISINGHGHFQANGGYTITLSGTPAFSQFVNAGGQSFVQANSLTFSGSASGVRYLCSGRSYIYTGSGSASYFPGSAAGSTSGDGYYE